MVGRMLEGRKWIRTAEYRGAEDAGELSEAYGGCYFVHCRNCLSDLGSGRRRLLLRQTVSYCVVRRVTSFNISVDGNKDLSSGHGRDGSCQSIVFHAQRTVYPSIRWEILTVA